MTSVAAAGLRARPLGVALVLGTGAAAVVALEWLRGGSPPGAPGAWLVAESCLLGLALLAAWSRQDDLRLGPLLVVTAGFQLALLLVHLHLGIDGDADVREVYRREGNELLDGHFPASSYPPGAVALFGLDVWLGGGSARASHGALMVPFQLVVVAAVWSLRTRTSAWLAALVALWPANVFFWEYRFDLVPAACLAVGLALAHRERWAGAAAALAVGTWVKWIPAVAAAGLVVAAAGRRRGSAGAARFALVFVLTLTALTIPFLLWDAGNVLDVYTAQGGRGLTSESLWYLPLRAVGQAEVNASGFIWDEAVRPGWADDAAVVLQVAAVLAALVACRRARTAAGALAAAALCPAVFLLTNRVFSPQFAVVLLACWAVAGALVCRTRREQLALGATAAAATAAQALVFPARVSFWPLASAAWFALALALTAALFAAALRPPEEDRGPSR
jgi:hypothetical protein